MAVKILLNTVLLTLFVTRLCLARQDVESDDKAALKTVTDFYLQVSKCCAVNAVLVQRGALGNRQCQNLSSLPLGVSGRARWQPVFFDLETATEVQQPKTFVLQQTFPTCDPEREVMYPVYHHSNTFDDLMLLTNGSLAHRLIHDKSKKDESESGPAVLYPPGKYCVDDMVIVDDGNDGGGNESVVEFAYICVDNTYDVKALIDDYVYPVGLAVSMLCLVATFLLYSFLPQLRDLTGKFILGICAFLAAAFALLLVKLFGWRDHNVNKVVTEFLLHCCVVGVWLCLNCMGHHVWKIVTAETVFTRVTDGKRLMYYSLYVVSMLTAVATLAVCMHFFVADNTDSVSDIRSGATLSWETISAFYLPVTAMLLINLYFYLTAQRRIARQIMYNRSMQHFQVNFDLFTKFLLVMGVWWLFFMLAQLELDALVYIAMTFHVIQGPLIFCVAMCRTRVAFLFKKYFCHESWCCCCAPKGHPGVGGDEGDFLDGADCKELAIIDSIKKRHQKEEQDEGQYTSLLPPLNPASPSSRQKDGLSRSLFNVRNQPQVGEVPAPPDPEMPVGRVMRLLKSNSLTALANINWGWRKETSV